jgi:hypothetical protein
VSLAIKGVNLYQNITIQTRGGTIATFMVRPARGLEPKVIADLYNSVVDQKYEAGIMIKQEHIESRLARDPEAVLVGLIDGHPVAFINTVKRKLKSDQEIPRTNQALTTNETCVDTDPVEGNYKFCNWVGVEPGTSEQGYRAGLFSLGQMMVLAAKTQAMEQKVIEKMFAYSRPSRLRKELENFRSIMFWKTALNKCPIIFGIEENRLNVSDRFFGYALTGEGAYCVKQQTYIKVIDISDYWEKTGKDGRKVEPVFQFHASLGAKFRPDLVFAHGQIFDWNSLGYRTLLEYTLER